MRSLHRHQTYAQGPAHSFFRADEVSIGPDLCRQPFAGQLGEESVQAPPLYREQLHEQPAWMRIREIGWMPVDPCLLQAGADSWRARLVDVVDPSPNSRLAASASPQAQTDGRTILQFLHRFSALFFPHPNPISQSGTAGTNDTSDLQLSSIIKDLASLIAIAAFCIGAGWLLVGVASSGGAI